MERRTYNLLKKINEKKITSSATIMIYRITLAYHYILHYTHQNLHVPNEWRSDLAIETENPQPINQKDMRN